MTLLERMVRLHWLRVPTFGLTLAVGLARPGVAHAQSDEQRAAARSIAVEGARACSEQRWQDCVNLFQRAESVVHAPPHLLYMARAEEKLGHMVRARELYIKINREHLADNAPQAFRDSQTAAAEGAQKLEPRIAYLTIQLAGDAGKAVDVTMDGKPLPAALVGVPQPVDPGEHRLEGKGPGLTASQQAAVLAEGERATATLTFQATPEAPAAIAPTAATPTPAATAPVADDGAPGGANTLRIASYAAFGVGAVGLGLGTAFLLSSSSKRADADHLYADKCPCAKTDPAAQQVANLDDGARSAGTISVVGFVLGGAGVAAGATMFFLSAKRNKEPSPSLGARVTPWVGFGSVGLSGTYW
jgi:hypothetical protein